MLTGMDHPEAIFNPIGTGNMITYYVFCGADAINEKKGRRDGKNRTISLERTVDGMPL